MATTSISSSGSSSTNAASAQTMTAAQLSANNKANAQKLVTSLGAGSGVDVASLAQNLVDAEQLPQANAINAKINKNDSKVSGVSAVMFMMSALKTSMSDLKDKDNFNKVTVSNSNSNAVNVSAIASAATGDHQITVNAISQPQRSFSTSSALPTSSLNSGKSFAFELYSLGWVKE